MRCSRIVFLAAVAGCGGSSVEPPPPPPPPPGPSPSLGCGHTTDLHLAVGVATVVTIGGGTQCLRLVAEGTPAEYLVVAVSGGLERVPGGITADYQLRGRSAFATPTTTSRDAVSPESPDRASAFHARLRELERAAAGRPRVGPPRLVSQAQPAIGDPRTFTVCGSLACTDFVSVPARVAYVGRSVAIYAEEALPSGGYEGDEIARAGDLFDRHIYSLDTTAFGRESDLDGNGRVIALLTKAVNRLTWPCLGGIIVGYFIGTDLTPAEPGSNAGEVLYTAVPDPNGEAGCRVTKDFATKYLAPTLMHELQHLINYNQHVLVRHGSAEESWLNEGLSHLAEELGGRSIPNGFCYLNDCLSQFAVPTLSNGYRYLLAPEDHFLVFPVGSTGSLSERGAAWLFLRWVNDHFGGGSAFTRALVETAETGAANLVPRVGVPLATLVGEWHLANWLDDLPGFTPQNPRLRYPSWNLRATFASFRAQAPLIYPRAFPLVPDSVGADFDLAGILRGGSGRYVRIVVSPAASPADVRLSGSLGAPLGAAVGGQLAVVRTH